jgi:hypothetical protein
VWMLILKTKRLVVYIDKAMSVTFQPFSENFFGEYAAWMPITERFGDYQFRSRFILGAALFAYER